MNNRYFFAIPFAICMAMSVVTAQDNAQPAGKPPVVVDNFIPTGALSQGHLVNIKMDADIQTYLKEFDDNVAKLPAEERAELRKEIKPGYPIPFNAKLGVSKEQYDKYLACWNNRQLEDGPTTAIQLTPVNADKTLWRLISIFERGALPLSTMQYDSVKGEWISPNGKLTYVGPVTFTKENQLGPWSGHEWAVKTSDDLGESVESVLLGKTDDKKYVYVIYNYLEVTKEGAITANESFAMRFPIGEEDPLRKKAKAQSK